jgi:hypothetical protein
MAHARDEEKNELQSIYGSRLFIVVFCLANRATDASTALIS